jgi:hypothetical protein
VAAGLLGIFRALAYELVARDELPSIRLGRCMAVPKVALLEMLLLWSTTSNHRNSALGHRPVSDTTAVSVQATGNVAARHS